jgi:hypothetical protein
VVVKPEGNSSGRKCGDNIKMDLEGVGRVLTVFMGLRIENTNAL